MPEKINPVAGRTQTIKTATPDPSLTTKVAQAPPPVKRILRPVLDDDQSKNKGDSMQKKNRIAICISAFIVALFGIGTGYFLVMMQSGGIASITSAGGNIQREVKTEAITKGTKVGIADEKTFKDSTEGTLEKGGIDGEGSHKIIRPGGESQTLYITSSVIDLDQFVGKKVKVWGETLSAKQAGWLMDVGTLEVLE